MFAIKKIVVYFYCRAGHLNSYYILPWFLPRTTFRKRQWNLHESWYPAVQCYLNTWQTWSRKLSVFRPISATRIKSNTTKTFSLCCSREIIRLILKRCIIWGWKNMFCAFIQITWFVKMSPRKRDIHLCSFLLLKSDIFETVRPSSYIIDKSESSFTLLAFYNNFLFLSQTYNSETYLVININVAASNSRHN